MIELARIQILRNFTYLHCKHLAQPPHSIYLQPYYQIIASPTLKPLQYVYRSQVHQVACPSPRSYPRSAHQGRDENRWRYLPARVECEGAQRGAGVGYWPGRTGQGRKESQPKCCGWRQSVDSSVWRITCEGWRRGVLPVQRP